MRAFAPLHDEGDNVIYFLFHRQEGDMAFDLVLTGGRVIDPSQDIDRMTDVAFADGKVAAVGDGPRGARGRRPPMRRAPSSRRG